MNWRNNCNFSFAIVSSDLRRLTYHMHRPSLNADTDSLKRTFTCPHWPVSSYSKLRPRRQRRERCFFEKEREKRFGRATVWPSSDKQCVGCIRRPVRGHCFSERLRSSGTTAFSQQEILHGVAPAGEESFRPRGHGRPDRPACVHRNSCGCRQRQATAAGTVCSATTQLPSRLDQD